MDEDLIGCVRLEPAEQFDKAIVGKVEKGDSCILVYDYDQLITVVATESNDGSARNLTEEQMSDAMEYVEFNTIRALPYMGDRRPLILYREFDLDEDTAETGD